MQTHRVSSVDGTSVGFRTLGSGPAVVFVHGSIDTGESWLPVAEGLSHRFTSCLIDRRGRGLSGDSEQYSLETEAADIAAVVAHVGPVAGLIGHSYGAICVLQALLAGTTAPAAVLYDPPLPVYEPVSGEGLPQFSHLLASGDADQALVFAMTTFAHASPEAVQALRRSRGWSELVSLTATWERELRAIDSLGPGVEQFARLTVPTTCLMGELANSHVRARTTALVGAMPDARIVQLPGQGQGPPAHRSAPEMLVAGLEDVLAPPGQ